MSEAAVPANALEGGRLAAQLSTDERLARRAAAGDERAFAAIFRRYHQDLYRYCLAILRNPDDAQDALQGTMVKALQALPGEPRQIELKPWLYRIAHNESIDLVRRRRASEPLPAELAAPGPGLARETEARERLGALLADLETLPERQRGALVMRELSGLGFAEIGAALGSSAAVARQTVYEARLSLRQIEAGREMRCAEVTKVLSEADGRVRRRREIRAHLRDCEDCRRFGEEIATRSRDLAALAPLPALVAGGLLQGIFGSQGASGLAGALGGGAAKVLGSSAALKATATVAVVAAIGAGAAQRADLIHVGLPGGSGTQSSQPEPARASEPGRSTPSPTSPIPATTGHARADALGAARAVQRAAGSPGNGIQDRPAAAVSSPANAPAATTEAARGRGVSGKPPLPEAASHGQQTAAAHKNSGHGASGNRGGANKPSHAATPAHPAHSNKPAKQPPAAQPPAGAAERGKSAEAKAVAPSPKTAEPEG